MKASPYLILALVFTVCFTVATGIEPRAANWSNRTKSDNVLGMLFGDGRKLFASQFFTMADVYFHSGYYPSIFDRSGEEVHIAEASQTSTECEGGHEGHEQHEGCQGGHEGHEGSCGSEAADFMGKSKDWVEAFGRNFRITEHTHLKKGGEREILPWLKLAAEMDPQMIETYTVGAYWLREQLDDAPQAEAFLREGLRNNPESYEILFELGRLYQDSLHDPDRARNVWELALRRWLQQPPELLEENKLGFEQITIHLARLEEKAGNWASAINWLQAAQKVSPAPGILQKQIDELKIKFAEPAGLPVIPVVP